MRLGLGLLAALLASCAGCEPVAGPEGEIGRILQSARSRGASFAVRGGGAMQLRVVHFDHVLVKPEGEGLVAVGKADAEGEYEGGVPVSYVGLERVPFVRRGRAWEPEGAILPALEEVAALLVERRAALEGREPRRIEALVAQGWRDGRLGREPALVQMRERVEAFSGSYRPTRWIVRVERGGAEVLEEFVQEGEAGASRGQVRFQLTREDGKLRFAAGLI